MPKHPPINRMVITLDCDDDALDGNILWLACCLLSHEQVFNPGRSNVPLPQLLEENGITVRRSSGDTPHLMSEAEKVIVEAKLAAMREAHANSDGSS